jgi:hypothetical protein
MSDDDRPRRSWREIDRAKDKSAHRKEERPDPGFGRRQGKRREKSYRAALDRLFDSGKIADLVEKQTGEKSSDQSQGDSRIKMHASITDATDRDALTRAVDSYLQKFGELPEDLAVLGRVLEHRDPTLQLEAMQRIDALLDREQPKRTRAMVGQLKMIRDIGDDPELTDLAKRLIERLE